MISSRTPEGAPNRCPICRSAIRIEPSRPFGDAPCPNCGCLLWFVAGKSETRFYNSADERLINLLAKRFNVDPDLIRADRWNELDIDSLDVVEMIMEFESE
jgi:hypothetical protein